MTDNQVIGAIVRKLVAELRPERIVLYGSYAYGEPDEDSDIDMLIVQETAASFIDRMVAAQEAVAELQPHVPFEPIVPTPGELAERIRRGDQFIRQILERGEVLHAA